MKNNVAIKDIFPRIDLKRLQVRICRWLGQLEVLLHDGGRVGGTNEGIAVHPHGEVACLGYEEIGIKQKSISPPTQAVRDLQFTETWYVRADGHVEGAGEFAVPHQHAGRSARSQRAAV